MADGVIKSSGPRPACERCRGQKLRCIWETSSPQCRRCARAKAVCTIPRARPMGRPPRQCRDNSSYFGCDGEHPPSLEDSRLCMQSSDESMPLDGLAPSASIEGHKTAGLPSPDSLGFLNYTAPIATFDAPSRSDQGLFTAPTIGPDIVADG
ncbi:Zn(II)2Cys6 transcription factor domain-containing protein [Aspergillus affinis]|uniref:Zn(II)2Cys6 transcription factor domain-containing protein n=1 Tax=Aspergillus affinis TaxID=1070780 RepID=UPI0022FEA98D|nr:uncharacterized protein KD926_002921 [Aspergillus affinis]KAI9035771.1 hypothetical protein KD926_002921 [Aspergillus affinis]